MFGLGSLFYISLLLINSIAVLSEDRFLQRIGWTAVPSQQAGFVGAQDESIKTKLVSFIGSVRIVLRAPLVVVNTVVIIYLLALG